ncbi:hypothetical protein CEP52_012972 [Fusarium oligoseptatum]|uniref:Alpha-1,3-mannosyltransferase CMT1 n=1 Tax=Fusarium oligoseptatum TaxID=2604345 RepID=A0A428SVS5_9HYPO|nr:hypothetical protein CEP52_012972 [Fusarium oligoseptatum]
MRQRIILLFIPALCFLLIATSLYLGREHLTRLSNLYLPIQHDSAEPEAQSSETTSSSYSTTSTRSNYILIHPNPPTSTSISVATSTSSSFSTPTPTLVATKTGSNDTIATPLSAEPPKPSIKNGAILPAKRIRPIINAILDPASKERPRLECPALDTERYASLLKKRDARDDKPHIDYFFTLNLRNVVDLLPRLLGSAVEAMRFLGPERCALSIVEGNSPDGTADVLVALRPFLEEIGVTYFYNNSAINPSNGARIRKLAQLRNLALQPLFKKKVPVSEKDDEDLLELAFQRKNLNADMTCAMDWTYASDDPTFYDVWVARGIDGDIFFNITQNGSWDFAQNLFFSDPKTKSRYEANLPFQVFACWNGATVFTAAPLLNGLRFRDSRKDECFQGEPQLFCKDLWFKGYRKIAAIPSVNLEYTDNNARRLKELKGYTSEVVAEEDEATVGIEWQYEPPQKVKCMPEFHRQSWLPWDEHLR